jgi:hypothetical protein
MNKFGHLTLIGKAQTMLEMIESIIEDPDFEKCCIMNQAALKEMERLAFRVVAKMSNSNGGGAASI